VTAPESPGARTSVDTLIVGPFQENTFFLRARDAAELIIVDPGEDADRLIATIQSHEWLPVAIVNTHAHLDHIGAVAPLKAEFEIPFYLHPADLPTLKSTPEHARMFGVRIPDVPAVDYELSDGQSLNLAGLTLDVIHTPGHTPGGVALAVDGRLFAGDTLFSGSIGRTDLPGGDLATLMNSLHARLMPLPDNTIVHSGHGPDTTIGHERRHNPFLNGQYV